MSNIVIFDGNGMLNPPAYWVLSECESIIRKLNNMSELINWKIATTNVDCILFSCAEIKKLRHDMKQICYDSIFCSERYYENAKSWQYFWTEFYHRTNNAYFQILHLPLDNFWKLNSNDEQIIEKYEKPKDLQFMWVTYENLYRCDDGENQIVRSRKDSANIVDCMKKIVADMQLIIDYCKEEIKSLEDAGKLYENLKRQTKT